MKPKQIQILFFLLISTVCYTQDKIEFHYSLEKDKRNVNHPYTLIVNGEIINKSNEDIYFLNSNCSGLNYFFNTNSKCSKIFSSHSCCFPKTIKTRLSKKETYSFKTHLIFGKNCKKIDLELSLNLLNKTKKECRKKYKLNKILKLRDKTFNLNKIQKLNIDDLYVHSLNNRLDILLSSGYNYMEPNKNNEGLSKLNVSNRYKFLEMKELINLSIKEKRPIELLKLSHKIINSNTIEISYKTTYLKGKRGVFINRYANKEFLKKGFNFKKGEFKKSNKRYTMKYVFNIHNHKWEIK